MKKAFIAIVSGLIALSVFLTTSYAKASDWSFDWGNYDSGYGSGDWNSINYASDRDYYYDNGIDVPDYYYYQNDQELNSYWDFANENNWSNDDYWNGLGNWDDWYSAQRQRYESYYQAYYQGRDYHPIRNCHYNRYDGRYTSWADDYNNSRRRILWADQNYPLGAFYDNYNQNWYDSWFNRGSDYSNYARGIAIRDRSNPDNVIIVLNQAGGNVNINRAAVMVDSATYNEICRLIDESLINNQDYDFRFNNRSNQIMYNYGNGWLYGDASYSYY